MCSKIATRPEEGEGNFHSIFKIIFQFKTANTEGILKYCLCWSGAGTFGRDTEACVLAAVVFVCSHQRKHAPTCFISAKVFFPPESGVRTRGWPLRCSFHLKQLHGSISHLLHLIQFMKVCCDGYHFWFLTFGEKILQVCLRQNLGVFFYKTQMDGFLFFYFDLVYLTCITFSFALIFRIWIVSSKKTCTARTLSPLLDILFLN